MNNSIQSSLSTRDIDPYNRSMAKKNKKSKSKAGSSTIAQNKRARFDYFIEDNYEAGIVLQGWEVKSLREGNISLNEAYVRIERKELWLIGADIAEYRQASFTPQKLAKFESPGLWPTALQEPLKRKTNQRHLRCDR